MNMKMLSIGILMLGTFQSIQAADEMIFKEQCALGLAKGESVETECKTRMTFEDGKVLCFSNREARDEFLQDPKQNLDKAEESFEKLATSN